MIKKTSNHSTYFDPMGATAVINDDKNASFLGQMHNH